jgi:hypothetical protein
MQLSIFPDIQPMDDAIFSNDRIYRYALYRFWDEAKGYVAFICLNPSTADETKNDPTVTRCINYAYSWGYGGMVMLNLFAFRATDPNIMMAAKDPIGSHNDAYIRRGSKNAKLTIIAWGVYGAHLGRSKEVLPLLIDPHYLSLNLNRQPGHPLYLRKDLKPKKYIYNISN